MKIILKENDLDPGPLRGKGTWDEFLKIHEDMFWQCDFVSKPMWTAKGLVDLYVLVFRHLGTRRVWISSCTAHPDSTWVSHHAMNFLMVAEDMNLPPAYVMRDNDAKFTVQFDAVIESSGAKVKRIVTLSPNLRAHVERFIQTLKVECLNRFVIVAERHLNYVCRVWIRPPPPLSTAVNTRPHSARDLLPPDTTLPPDQWSTVRVKEVVCTSRLGGVINSYSRRSA